jgi:hypothetical protein
VHFLNRLLLDGGVQQGAQFRQQCECARLVRPAAAAVACWQGFPKPGLPGAADGLLDEVHGELVAALAVAAVGGEMEADSDKTTPAGGSNTSDCCVMVIADVVLAAATALHTCVVFSTMSFVQLHGWRPLEISSAISFAFALPITPYVASN